MGKRIIPCLDIKDGQVVKGVSFQNLKKAGLPRELAVKYQEEGAHELVFLDISATSKGRKIHLQELGKVSQLINIPLTAGGGIGDLETIEEILALGVSKVSINTAGVKDPSFIAGAVKRFGRERVVVAIDAKKRSHSWEVMIGAGQEETGLDTLEWASSIADMGVLEILLTSIDADGRKEGYDNILNQEVYKASSLAIIASGGAGHPQHLYEALTVGKADAVLLASILHFQEYGIKEIREYLTERGVELKDGH